MKKKIGRKKKEGRRKESKILNMQYINKSSCILRSRSFFNFSKYLNKTKGIQNNKREIKMKECKIKGIKIK